jgi:ABC-2 type transport system permease protein
VARLSTLRFLGALVATNLKSSFALRGAFWLQAVFMVGNNFIYFAMWWILFERFEEIGGWRISDMLTLFGVVAAGFGVSVTLAGGVRELARTIVEGELDTMMTQPKSLLLHVVASRSFASGWGDLATGVLMLGMAGQLTPSGLAGIVPAVAASACVLTATGVMIHSLAFWLGRMDNLARQLWEFTLTFSLYPSALFGGALKLVLFTLVPAGFIGYLPAELVRKPSVTVAISVAGGVVVYSVVALAVFHLGLRRYESGNRLITRAV